MNIGMSGVSPGDLGPEWERIDLLALCLSAARRGQAVAEELHSHLKDAHEMVRNIRMHSPWKDMSNRYGLSAMDQDILACAIAPEAEPRIGWIYQELQPGITSTYPTPALIREMFGIDQHGAESFQARLASGAPLLRNRLIEHPSDNQYQPLRPTNLVSSGLLGWTDPAVTAPPGAVEVPVKASWDDLVLPASCVQGMRELMLWVTHRDMVMNEWGARLQGGPVGLFAGPSGTGKTFAGEVLANALGWPLFRVDLGMLVSKYIGETEKNLNALFDAAHGQAMVLLFDEADSLFGKRGEVKDARDRYANMEVSHLLSRMERHQGPCILTSNLRRHLDVAFARRFQVVIEFPRPDASARAELWHKHLPPQAPCANDVNPIQLGETLNLTGGQIRNAALHAAFLAAGEDGKIELQHVARAVWMELGKEGRERIVSSLGYLAEHLKRENEI